MKKFSTSEKDKMTNILRFVFAFLTVLNCTRGINPAYRVISGVLVSLYLF